MAEGGRGGLEGRSHRHDRAVGVRLEVQGYLRGGGAGAGRGEGGEGAKGGERVTFCARPATGPGRDPRRGLDRPPPRAPRGAARLLQGIRCRCGQGAADLEPCRARRVHCAFDQRVRAHPLRVVRARDVWAA